MSDFYRVRRLPPYVFEQVNRLKAKARAGGADIIDLGMGNPDLPTPRHVVDKLVETAGKPRTDRYSASKGIPGLRRAQASSRSAVGAFQWDPANGGLVKVNPLCGWSLEQVWAYVKAHHVPYNPLHDQGYPSIGCAPCTRAVRPGEDVRSGRWWWEQPGHRECGLHDHSPKKAVP